MNKKAALLSRQSTPLTVQSGPAGVMGMPGLGCTAVSLPVLLFPAPLMGLAPHAVATAAGCAWDVEHVVLHLVLQQWVSSATGHLEWPWVLMFRHCSHPEDLTQDWSALG